MLNIAIISGWLGCSELKEFYREDDGRSDFIIKLVQKFKNFYNVYTKLEDIRSVKIDIEIHLNFQIKKTNAKKVFLILLESDSIRPQNYFHKYFLFVYTKIFTWNDLYVKKDKIYKKFFFPHDYSYGPVGDFSNRNIFISMIASNRNAITDKENSLYFHRVKIINWFNKHEPNNFCLYGKGWDFINHPSGFIGRVFFEIVKKMKVFKRSSPLKVWMGGIPHKNSILIKSKFSIVYENLYNQPGYISEKIYDCFSAGCIPIYHPAFPGKLPFPEDTYIDIRRFNSLDDLNNFLLNLSSEEFTNYQKNIRNYIHLNKNKNSIRTFIKIITEEIYKCI